MHSRIQLGAWLKTHNWPQRLKGTKKLTRRNEVFTHLGVFATSCLHKVRRFGLSAEAPASRSTCEGWAAQAGTQAWRYCSTDSLALLALTALIIVCTVASPAQNSKAGAQDTTQVQRADSASHSAPEQTLWGNRRFIGTVLSVLIPGSGQTYLGHTEKGAAFTLGTLACGLVTTLSESNAIGRNERLTELTAQYRIATNYIGSDTLWTKMVSTKSLLDQTVSRRNLFLKLTVAFWVANIVDMVFFTDDKGEKPFGSLETGKRTTFALVPDAKNGVNAVLTIQF